MRYIFCSINICGALLYLLFFSFLFTGCSNSSEITEYKNPVSIYLLSDTSGVESSASARIGGAKTSASGESSSGVKTSAKVEPSVKVEPSLANAGFTENAREEWFIQVKDFSKNSIKERSFIPWPQAVRISDIAETENGTIVFLINKKGIIAGNGAGGLLSSSKISHENLDKYTSGKIITNRNSILCHVYIDTFFDKTLSCPISPFIEIDIDNKKSINSQHKYPAVIKNFSLINLKKIEDKWFSAWKKSDTKGTKFKYFVHNTPLGENAKEISESGFMLADQFLNKSNLPDQVKKFIFNITKKEINNCVIELELRNKDNPAVITYLLKAAGSESSHYEKMCVSLDQGSYFLSYKGEIFLIEKDNLYLLTGVEKLPQNISYTVLYVSGNTLYAAWEEQNFFFTGASGLTLIDKKRVDKIQQ